MMRRWWWVVCSIAVFAGTVTAQDDALTVGDVQLVNGTDIYGQPTLMAEGQVTNSSQQAYNNLSLQATAYDKGGQTVGEGFGYLVNACGAALLPDFVLLPGAAQAFAVPLELDEADATVDHVEVTAQGEPDDATSAPAAALADGIRQVSGREVVSVEWVDDKSLRFGAGCYRDVFTNLEWFNYQLKGGDPAPTQHPKAELVTEALRRQLGLLDPLYFAHSFLSFAPNARRIVYQTEINTVISAEPDGSFKRVLFEQLFNRTLQGITWLEKGRFLAYYYGAYGDPVLYFTADVEGQVISEPASNALPSITVPGASPDGSRIIISTEVDGKAGYYLKQAINPNTSLLFEAEVPGNNWPGPIYELDSDSARFVYLALPINGEARLECFNMQSKTLHDLAPLPLQLATDERASWWLSPDHSTIALAANGVHGGLWLISLDKMKTCE